MIPRGQLDIGWSDLASAAFGCLAGADREAKQRDLESLWAPEGDALACLSVRSGLDLLLGTLAYPKGSEVLVSAVTIRDMVKIVEHHGLVPVPVDLDMRTATLKLDALARACSLRTRAILVAHLFGARMPMDAISAFARRHGLLLGEDCAQSFTGMDYRGDPASDVSLFSFGPIKTASALGGALLRIRDEGLRLRMRLRQQGWPVQRRGRFLKRVLRFALVRLALCRAPFTALCAACQLAGRNHDELISHSVRGFSGPDFFASIRRQPSRPLLALLRRRLLRFEATRIARRTATAEAVAGLMAGVPRPGRDAGFHSYWTFPIRSASPDDLVRELWARGFDATRGAWSLCAVPAPAHLPHLAAPEAEAAMREIVYLPVSPRLPRRKLEQLAAATATIVERAPVAGGQPTIAVG